MEDERKENQKVNISDSKNVISGSEIKGQNVHIGDIVHHHSAAAPEGRKKTAYAIAVRKLVSKGNLKGALNALADVFGDDDAATDQVHLLNSRLSNLNKENRMGLLSFSEANLQRNKITNSILELLRDLDDA